jgi:tetratricopeptide (TPR) repeat protein
LDSKEMRMLRSTGSSILNAELMRALESGYGLLRDGRVADALTVATTLVERHPDSEHALVYASEAHLADGNPESALAWISKAVLASGGNAALKLKMATLLMRMRRRQQGCALIGEILTMASLDGKLLWQAGAISLTSNFFSEAIRCYERAREQLGDVPALLYDLAAAYFFSGEFERAERALERLLLLAPDAGPALYLRSTLRRQTLESNHVDDLRKRLAAGISVPNDEAAARYALSKELEDLGEDVESFAQLQRAALQKRGTLRGYSLTSECEALAAVRASYSHEIMGQAVHGHNETGAIFIVGMPRSGTTLVERLLVQSGRVRSAGELLDFGNLLSLMTQAPLAAAPGLTPAEASLRIDYAALGREYMRGAREAAGGSACFIDKLPVNYIYCGIIRKALPNAKIIHLVRDPVDTCHAVFKTLFFDAYPFSYDQNEIADYYIAYQQMMRHWHEVMPGSILDVRYEDLVANPGEQTRRIFDWCSLEWSPDVLDAPTDATVFASASAAQVREPVHGRSVHRSRRHRDGLATLISKLQASGIAID